jgi:hypothetical protein
VAQNTADSEKVHPTQSPRQRTLRRRINNYSIYRTVRRAIRDCEISSPILLAPCGYGWFFQRYQRDGYDIVGIDIDPQTVEDARTAISPAPRIVLGSILEMPFKDNEFDFVVNNRFMLHFDEDFRAQAFKELARVTSRFLLVHYDVGSVRQFLRRLRGARKTERQIESIDGWRKTQRRDRKLLFTREMMEAEGAKANFRVRKLYHVCYGLSDRVYCLFEKNV